VRARSVYIFSCIMYNVRRRKARNLGILKVLKIHLCDEKIHLCDEKIHLCDEKKYIYVMKKNIY